MSHFPKDFLWGGATSAAQYEGGWNEGGRGPTLNDVTTGGSVDSPRMITWIDKYGSPHASSSFNFTLPEGASYAVLEDYYYPNHIGSDFYHHWKEDIQLFAEMGFKVFRLSISWSRLFPTGLEEEPNPEGIEFYRRIFNELKVHHIEPLVTLWHFDTPLHLEEELGGWNDRALIDLYAHFAQTCFENFKGLVKYWLTFNEINHSLIVLENTKAEVTETDYQKAYQQLHYQLLASAKAVQLAHEIDPSNLVGCMISGIVSYPATNDPKDVILNRHAWEKNIFYPSDVQCKGEYPVFANRLWKEYHIHLEMSSEDMAILKAGVVDYFAFSYYMSTSITSHQKEEAEPEEPHAEKVKNKYLTYSDWGWALDPEGLRYFLEVVYDRYHKPIMIVENGLGAQDTLDKEGKIHDPYRIDYYRRHIKEMSRAIEDGVDLIGYTIWGCIDLVSSGTGEMKKRYGLIYVDLDDTGKGSLERKPKDSFYWYKKVIESNGEDLE